MSLAVLRRLRAGARGVVGAVLEEAAATEKSWTRGEVRGLQVRGWLAGWLSYLVLLIEKCM